MLEDAFRTLEFVLAPLQRTLELPTGLRQFVRSGCSLAFEGSPLPGQLLIGFTSLPVELSLQGIHRAPCVPADLYEFIRPDWRRSHATGIEATVRTGQGDQPVHQLPLLLRQGRALSLCPLALTVERLIDRGSGFVDVPSLTPLLEWGQ